MKQGLHKECDLLYYEYTEWKTAEMCQKEALALPQVNAFVELLKKYR